MTTQETRLFQLAFLPEVLHFSEIFTEATRLRLVIMPSHDRQRRVRTDWLTAGELESKVTFPSTQLLYLDDYELIFRHKQGKSSIAKRELLLVV